MRRVEVKIGRARGKEGERREERGGKGRRGWDRRKEKGQRGR